MNKYNPLVEEFAYKPICIPLTTGVDRGIIEPIVSNQTSMIDTVRLNIHALPAHQQQRFNTDGDKEWLQIDSRLWGTDTGSTLYAEAWSGLNGRLKDGTEEYELQQRSESRFLEIMSGIFASNTPDPDIEPSVVIYPRPNSGLHEADLFPSKRINDITLYVSSGELWHDNDLSNIQLRELFSKQVFAVAGASVGSEVIMSIAKEFNPQFMRLTDVKGAHPAVRNRTNYPRRAMGDAKHHIMARWLYDRNPYMDVEVIDGGIQNDNIEHFVFGDEELCSPQADFIIEETDDIRAKMSTLKAAVGKVNTLMATDAGHIGQIDFWKAGEDYQIGQIPNEELEALYQKSMSDPKVFVPLLKALLGDVVFDAVSRGRELPMQARFREILDGSYNHKYSGLPQLGSVATMNAALSVQLIGNHILGNSDRVKRQTLMHALEGVVTK